MASRLSAKAVFLLSDVISLEMKDILAGRKDSLNIAQMKLSTKNPMKLVTAEYKKRKEPVEIKEIIINFNAPILSLNFPEKGAEMKAPIP
jgi:hypothetical protein